MRNPITTAILTALVVAGGLSAPLTQATTASAVSSGPYKKILLRKDQAVPNFAGAQLLEDYGSFALYKIDAASLAAAQAALPSLLVDDDADRLQFTTHPFDTQNDVLVAPSSFSLQATVGASLQLVQFVGPIKPEWLAILAAHGITPVHYVASNGYIVWADEAAQAQLADLRATVSWLQYSAPFYGFLKVDPELSSRLSTNPAANDEVDVVVQVYAHTGVDATQQFVVGKGVVPTAQQAPLGAGSIDYRWTQVLAFENLHLRVRLSDIAAIAERPDVTFVGMQHARKLMDEKQDLILAGTLSPGPTSPSYLQFLTDRGFSQTPGDYPIVDVSDSTIDEGGSGVTVLHTVDPFLHVNGDLSQPVRVAYFNNCSALPNSQVGAYDGHGSLNAGIIADYDQSTGFPYQDGDGKHLGLGINPFGRVGSTAIFSGSPESFDISACGNSEQGVILRNWQGGARISSNSWGESPPSTTYDESDQAYDVGVRDADPTTAGNQSMIYVFAAGNAGPGPSTVSSPGAGKNVITVGASENMRPFPTPSDNQCGTDPASNPENVVGFSSRGPVPGARAKPEVIAPGTHIQAAASVYSGYTGGGVCVKYYPESPAQTIFTYSSGTSHSTPAVSGVASLAYWWIAQGGAGAAAGSVDEIGGHRAPSPALMKAWLMAHPNYLTGTSANDNLPSNNQGYGMPNMSDMFSTTPKVLLDQSEVFTASGQTRTYDWSVADATQPVRIAMAYTDVAGQLGTSPQVNNLDLSVTVNGQTYLGNHFSKQWSVPGGSADGANNYEAVFLPAGTTGDLTITIAAANIAGDALNSGSGPSQDFALVCNNCAEVPSFMLATAQPSLQVCAGGEQTATVQVKSIDGFTNPVTLSASGNPNGVSAAFSPNPAAPDSASALTISATAGTAVGQSTTTITGTSGSIAKTLSLDLGVFSGLPTVPSGASPADGTANVSTTPTLSWSAASGAYDYLVQIATDPAFAHVVASHTTTDTAWTLGAAEALSSSTQYYWRVIAQNPCGQSLPTQAPDTIFANGFDLPVAVAQQAFTTLLQAGDCAVGVAPTLVFGDDMESGAPGWTHAAASGSIDTWTLGSSAHSGAYAWQANAPASGAANGQWLISPAITMPAVLSTLSLSYWDQQSIKSGGSGICFDGALVEASTDGGSTWTQLANPSTEAYDGAISGAFGNPLGGKQGWCGDPRTYTRSVVGVQGYAGQSVRFRFNLGHDRLAHRSNPNWAIDDVKVTGCAQ